MTPSLKAIVLQPMTAVIVSAVVAVGSVAYAVVVTTSKPEGSYVHPVMGQVVEQVSTTGEVKAAQAVDLSFQTSGRIASTHYDVGSHVASGAVLATLSSADQEAQLEQAKANLAMQKAKLQSIEKGATSQTIGLSQTGVANAKAALATAQAGLLQASDDAYLKADDAIHNRVDLFFTNSLTQNPTIGILLNDSQTQISLISGRVNIESTLTQWKAYEEQLQDSDPASVDPADVVATTKGYIQKVSDYLDLASKALTEVIPTTTITPATVQSYQASVATGRSNLSTALSALNAANTAYTNAQSGLSTASAQLSVTQTPASDSDVAAQEAVIAGAQAQVDLAQAQLGKAVIVAPIAGVITVDNANRGATANPGVPLISIISDSKFQIETDVSEADLAKVAVGDLASVALDAYQSDQPFSAHVIKIDPSANVDSGVAAYKVTLQFDQNDPRIKSGMSGSVVITTHTRQGVLTIPSTAIIRNGTSTQVLKRVGAGDSLVPVEVGISGGGSSEVVSGLSESDMVRSFGKQ